jgi:predicted HD phosphohydrolase
MKDPVFQIIHLFNEQGDSEYGGEPVTQGEHALQSAHLAMAEGASSSLVLASLLHDVGHLLHALPDDAPDQGIDDLHEELGYRFLQKYFGPAVSEPVHLHVAAKR